MLESILPAIRPGVLRDDKSNDVGLMSESRGRNSKFSDGGTLNFDSRSSNSLLSDIPMEVIATECESQKRCQSESIAIKHIRKRIGTGTSTTSDYCSLETE